LTNDQLQTVIDCCLDAAAQADNNMLLWQKVHQYFAPSFSTGWMCAQKSPIDGLYHVMTECTVMAAAAANHLNNQQNMTKRMYCCRYYTIFE
jgi:hypothetical protein